MMMMKRVQWLLTGLASALALTIVSAQVRITPAPPGLVTVANNVVAQRNGTNPQILQVYNTFTDESNYERGIMEWSGNALTIGTQVAGTGTNRQVYLQGIGLNLVAAGNTEWTITSPGYLTGTAILFASLGTPGNGALIYCSDCTIANPCAGAGAGAFAKRLNATWICN